MTCRWAEGTRSVIGLNYGVIIAYFGGKVKRLFVPGGRDEGFRDRGQDLDGGGAIDPFAHPAGQSAPLRSEAILAVLGRSPRTSMDQIVSPFEA